MLGWQPAGWCKNSPIWAITRADEWQMRSQIQLAQLGDQVVGLKQKVGPCHTGFGQSTIRYNFLNFLYNLDS